MLDSFIAHSSMPVQKIIWAYEGTYDENNPYWVDEYDEQVGIHWQHLKIPFDSTTDCRSVLLDGIWTSNDWASAYPISFEGDVGGFVYVPSSGGGGAWVQATEDFYAQIGAQYFSLYGRSSFGNTLKFRVWAYLKETDFDSIALQNTASSLASNFQKTTDLAQLNLVAEIEHKMTSGETWTYNHNLGFRPLVRVWNKYHLGDAEGTYDIAHDFIIDSLEHSWTISAPTFHIDDSKIIIHSDFQPEFGDAITYLVRIYNYDTAV